jgi:hypothetical protein
VEPLNFNFITRPTKGCFRGVYNSGSPCCFRLCLSQFEPLLISEPSDRSREWGKTPSGVAPPGVPELNAHIRQRTKGGVGGLQPIAQNGINNLVGGCGVPLLPNKERLKGSAATLHCPEQLLTDTLV